ncbi:MAG: hypothetical protein M3280_09245 [Actinomycetota bacterium]|nr:hypothetical protein [Actinomycetota bacterium]
MDQPRRAVLMSLTVLLLVACGTPETARVSDASQDVLFLASPRGLLVTEVDASSPNFRGVAVPSSDWSTIVRTNTAQGSTNVVAVESASGAELWERTVPGGMEAKVVSGNGDLVVLSPLRQAHYRYGRKETHLVVTGRDVAEPQSILLEGNFEPEAFSTDGGSLFVIRYLPARAPKQYQVRRLDLRTERVRAVYTQDAELQEAMGGTARIQTSSRDGRFLYTLYTIRSGESRYAFIHVLNLDDLWAHCIDLPVPFATTPESATALSTSPDGKRLYVINTAVGMIAEVDTKTLQVVRTDSIAFDSGDTTYAAHDSGSTLYLAARRRVVGIDTTDLSESRSWLMSQPVSGIQTTGDSERLYVGLRNQVVVLDAGTGARVRALDPPGIKRIDQLGPVTRTLEETRDSFTCAC